MQVPLEVNFQNVQKNEALENLINEKVAKLEQICDYLTSCRIYIDKPHENQRSGNPYQVVIEIHVPPKHEIITRREPGEGDLHDPLDSVLRDAFDAAKRQLQELVERQRGETKKHPEQEAVAIVDRLFPEADHGFIKTLEGEDIYFHRNSVVHNDFDRLEIGTGVRYVAKEGEKGLQASTVQIVDKPGSRTSTE